MCVDPEGARHKGSVRVETGCLGAELVYIYKKKNRARND